MKGIVLNENGAPVLAGGSVQLGDADGQTIETVLRANRGELKEAPLVGGETVKMLGGTAPTSLWCANIKKQLQSVGVDVKHVEASASEIVVKR